MNLSLQETLQAGQILIADGAAGTMLMAGGLPSGAPPDLWNIERPESILGLHRAYLDAGSQIILTNTFGANRLKLEKFGLGQRAEQLSRAGADLALQAAGGNAFVAGDIGPTGELMAPFGPLTFNSAVEVFTEQARALVAGGVHALWVETMTDLEEARAAVTAARQVSDLPVFCSLSFGKKGRTMMGVSGKAAAEALWPLGLAAIGANCGEGLDPVEIALKELHATLPAAPLIAKPNAGLPRMVDGETIYDVEPGAFAARIQDFVGLGARVVGACCGSNPEYIRAISAGSIRAGKASTRLDL